MIVKIDLNIPYGKRFLKFSLPSDRLLGVLENPSIKTKDVKKLLSESFVAHQSKNRLDILTRDKKKVLIVVPDCTRSAHLREILPPFLRRIRNKPCGIDIIVATGLHKKHNMRQLGELLGGDVIKQYNVISHDHAEKSLINLGSTKDGIPIILNKNLKNHDLVVSIGVIEPHLYAGYSGGAKTVAIGLAGEGTINATHNVKFLDNPLTKIGSIKENSFQNALWEIIDKSPIGFSVNVVNDQNGRALKIFSGTPREVFKDGTDFAKRVFEVEVKKPSSLAICGIGYPKDINLYQASRAINYILNDRPIIRKGGVLIVAAELKRGAGDGVSEKRFYKELKNMGSPEDFTEKIKRKGCIAGEHRAYMVAKGILDYKIIFVSKGRKNLMKGLPFGYFENLYDALDCADGILGRGSKIYVIPRALSTIARLKS